MVDSDTLERAHQIASKSHPEPTRLPLQAAAMAVVITIFIFVVFHVLDEWFGEAAAEIIVIGLAGLGAFLDCRQRWRLHMDAYMAAVRRLEGRDKP